MSLENNPATQGEVIYCGEGLNMNKPVPAIPWYML